MLHRQRTFLIPQCRSLFKSYSTFTQRRVFLFYLFIFPTNSQSYVTSAFPISCFSHEEKAGEFSHRTMQHEFASTMKEMDSFLQALISSQHNGKEMVLRLKLRAQWVDVYSHHNAGCSLDRFQCPGMGGNSHLVTLLIE